jgi:arylsulfatase A-like enzyme
MPAPNILVVVVDGLRASALGAYGNTSFSTPALDHFAAESCLLDWCYAPTAELDAVYRATWHSIHPASGSRSDFDTAALPRQLASHGYHTTFVSDDRAWASPAAAAGFDERVDSGLSPEPESRANDVSQTWLASSFGVACHAIQNRTSGAPRLIWMHSRGMYGPWDAPLELQRALLDEDDPPPIEPVPPPDFVLSDSGDPDAGFRFACAYSAQVMVLDSCWAALMEAIDSAAAEGPWLVTLLGARGYPLGEHHRVGGVDPRMYGEQLHVPWIARFPDGCGRLSRSGQLTSHVDLAPTIMDSLGESVPSHGARRDGMSIRTLARSSRPAWRESLISASSHGQRAIRNAEWCLRQDAPTGEQLPAHRGDTTSPRTELYVRPDDRWETNDVAKLCPDVIETLSRTMDDELRRFPEPAAQAME